MSDIPQLTAGICSRININVSDDDELFNIQPTVQLLSFKKIPPTSGPSVDRYRVIVSDGEHFVQSMLATQLNYLVEEDAIAKCTIAIIEKFSVNLVQGKR